SSTYTPATLFWDPHQYYTHTNQPVSSLGGTGNWDTSTKNWYNQNTHTSQLWPINAVGVTALFDGTSGTITVASGLTTGAIQFNDGGYLLQGGSITLGGPSVVDVANGFTDTINSSIYGTVG